MKNLAVHRHRFPVFIMCLFSEERDKSPLDRIGPSSKCDYRSSLNRLDLLEQTGSVKTYRASFIERRSSDIGAPSIKFAISRFRASC